MRLSLFCLLFILGGFNQAFAGTLTVNFSSTSQIISNSAVLNMTSTQLRPPYKINGWDLNGSAPPPQNKNFDVGDGSLGVFDNTTYNNFDQDGDPSNNIIQLNTNDYPNGYSFSQFTLDAGITLKPEGSQPLILKVLGDVSVSGTIDCSGNSGEAINVSSSLNATTGGVGRCGGANGGDGGSSSVNPNAGSDISVSVTGGGAGGVFTGSGGIGGGGGGAHTLSTAAVGGEDPSTASANDGGVAGASSGADPGFELIQSGAGGGGGSYIASHSGGAGGAGGGFIALYVAGNFTLENTGYILANGGAGGGDGVAQSGGGGGGGGGSISVFVGGNLTNNRINGFQALGGMGGSTGNSNNEGSSGGNGSVGRFWATDADKTFSGTGSENAPSILIAEQGIVDSQVGQFETVFGVFDSGTLHPIIDSIQDASNVPSGSSLNYFVASSKEQSFSTTTWQGLSTVTGQKLDRYLKIKVVMDNQVESDPVTLSSLSINYSDGDEMEFDFISACGGVDTLNGYWSLILYLMPITLFLIMKLKILYWDSHSLRF